MPLPEIPNIPTTKQEVEFDLLVLAEGVPKVLEQIRQLPHFTDLRWTLMHEKTSHALAHLRSIVALAYDLERTPGRGGGLIGSEQDE